VAAAVAAVEAVEAAEDVVEAMVQADWSRRRSRSGGQPPCACNVYSQTSGRAPAALARPSGPSCSDAAGPADQRPLSDPGGDCELPKAAARPRLISRSGRAGRQAMPVLVARARGFSSGAHLLHHQVAAGGLDERVAGAEQDRPRLGEP
jgi:hypothetical protein